MLRKLSKIIIPVLLAAAALTAFCSFGAGAATVSAPPQKASDILNELSKLFNGDETSDDDTDQPDTQYFTEATEPATEPIYTEPPTEAPTEWVPAYVETTPPDDYDAIREEYNNLLDAEEPTGINAVKMDKSISNKAYTTDNTAGIVSWICVGVGLVVVLVMLVSTKLTGSVQAK